MRCSTLAVGLLAATLGVVALAQDDTPRSPRPVGDLSQPANADSPLPSASRTFRIIDARLADPVSPDATPDQIIKRIDDLAHSPHADSLRTFHLTVLDGQTVALSVGSQVPVTMATTSAAGTQTAQFQMRDTGTQISLRSGERGGAPDDNATGFSAGAVAVIVSFEDSGPIADATHPDRPPTIEQFRVDASLRLAPGQRALVAGSSHGGRYLLISME